MAEWEAVNNSPLNSMDEVKGYTDLMRKRVYLHDTTLRDGEQFPGVEFTKAEKIKIACALSDYGVHRIEVMPAVSREDQETVAELNGMGLQAEIVGFCRAVKGDVQKAADAGCKSVVVEIQAYPQTMQALGWTFEQATGKMIETSHFAKSLGLRVTLFFVLVTQGPFEFGKRFIQKCLAEGVADSVAIPDTFGTMLPWAYYHYIRKVREWTDKPIEVHPHNNYSLGAANALAGVMAGAEVVHACVNGLGEGGGNAPLEAVALDLQLMLGVETGIHLEKTYELCKLVAEASRLPLQANWPLVGDRVFQTESGISVDVITKLMKAGLLPMQNMDIPTVIGTSRRFVLGKMSGRNSIKVKMTQLGLPAADDAQVDALLEKVKNRSIEIHNTLSDEEFREMVLAMG